MHLAAATEITQRRDVLDVFDITVVARRLNANNLSGQSRCPYKTTSSPRRDSIVQELCESRGGRPELSVLTSLLVSVDVKNY